MNGIIQANLKPETIQRITEITNKPASRGLDRMINECFDKLESEIPKENKVFKCPEMMEVIKNGEEE